MDGLFHGQPYFLMDDLGGENPLIFGNTHIYKILFKKSKNYVKYSIHGFYGNGGRYIFLLPALLVVAR